MHFRMFLYRSNISCRKLGLRGILASVPQTPKESPELVSPRFRSLQRAAKIHYFGGGIAAISDPNPGH